MRSHIRQGIDDYRAKRWVQGLEPGEEDRGGRRKVGEASNTNIFVVFFFFTF